MSPEPRLAYRDETRYELWSRAISGGRQSYDDAGGSCSERDALRSVGVAAEISLIEGAFYRKV